MKRYIILFLLFAGIQTMAQDTTLCLQRAAIVLEGLQKNEFSELEKFYAPEFKNALPPTGLSGLWTGLETSSGKFVKSGTFRTQPYASYLLVTTSLTFEKKQVQLVITFLPDNTLGGLHYVPLKMLKSYDLEDNAFFKEQEIVVPSEVELPGILTLPKGKTNVPAIVLVHGSGKVDRDEDVNGTKVFRDIAHALAKKGIASIRYDKRTLLNKGYDPNNWTVWDGTINDALAAVKFAKTFEEIDAENVFIVGHSLGANQTPRILQQDESIKGGVMLAGNARQLQDLIWDQSNYILGLDGISKEDEANLKVLKKQIKRANNAHCYCKDYSPNELPIGYPQAFYRDLNQYFPTETARDIPQPLMIVQGERDYQVTMKEYKIWKKKLRKKENVIFKSYPKLNHLLVEGEGKSSPDEYKTAGNVSEELLSDIAEWILQQSK